MPNLSEAPVNHMILTGGIVPHSLQLAENQHYTDANFGYSQAAITVFKTVDHHVVTVPSGTVNFTISVENSAAVDVRITEIVDTIFGDITQKPGCSLTSDKLSPGANYSCSFTEILSGNAGDKHVNSVKALAFDDAQNVVYDSDSAIVAFIDVHKGSIGQYIWNDLNANGIYDPKEPYLDDVTIALSGDAVGTTMTQNGGYYSFIDLAPGDYTIEVTDTNRIVSGHVLTSTPKLPYSTTLSPGNMIDEKANFGYVKGHIDISKTADHSIITSGTNVVFKIIVSNSGAIPLNITKLIDSDFGDLIALGDCTLLNPVAPGTDYPCSFTRTITGSHGDTHHNVISVTAEDIDNHEYSASDEENVDIVSDVSGAVGYMVWFDMNDDGNKDDNEPGIEGITLDLIQNGSVIKSTTTDSEGHYCFTAVNGSYEVIVTDSGHILDKAELSTGSTNPHGPITINDNIIHTANFGYKLSSIVPVPYINVTKTGSTSTINSSELVTFSIHVENIGTVEVILTQLIVSVFGSWDGKGSCQTGGAIPGNGSYTCSFSQVLTGTMGDAHHNIVFAVSIDSNQRRATAADDWFIDFITQQARNIPGLSTLGTFLLISLVLLSVYRKNKESKNI